MTTVNECRTAERHNEVNLQRATRSIRLSERVSEHGSNVWSHPRNPLEPKPGTFEMTANLAKLQSFRHRDGGRSEIGCRIQMWTVTAVGSNLRKSGVQTWRLCSMQRGTGVCKAQVPSFQGRPPATAAPGSKPITIH